MSRQAAASGLAIAALALVGWLFGMTTLQSLHPSLVAMSVVTAVSLGICAVAVLLLQRGRSPGRKRLGILLGTMVFAFAWLKLLHGLTSLDALSAHGGVFGPGGVYPTAMSTYTAAALVPLSAALMLMNLETKRGLAPAQLLALASLAVAFFVLIGYAFEVRSIIQGTASFPMALNTAIGLLLVNLGVLCARPTDGPMVMFSRSSPGGHLMRRLLPAFFALPFALGWLRLQAERASLFEAWFGVALMTTLMTASFMGLTWWNAYALDAKEKGRQEAEAATRRRELELREAYEQLKEADRHKDEVLSVVSHELKTPLNFIMGFVSFLQEGLGGPLNAEQQDYADKAMGGTERLHGLIDDLVEYARILSNRLKLDPVPTPLADLLEDVCEQVAPAAAEKRLSVAVTTDLQALACVDGYRLAQAIRKLLDNAVKFTPEGGHIAVDATLREGVLTVEVSDTGPGIPAELQGSIFQHFRQADMSATRERGGLGLGLAIAQGIIRAHGGTLGVRSAPGHGSTFWMTLPAACDD
jgi:signal transduction histidine kinase